MKNTNLLTEIIEILKESSQGADTHEDKKIAEAEKATTEYIANRLVDYLEGVEEISKEERAEILEHIEVEDINLIY